MGQNDNSKKIILDLCGGSGAWSRPYKEAGYDVRLITLPDNDVRTYQPPDNVYGILAAPPCTEFSIAKGRRSRDFESGLEIVQACIRIIWTCRIKKQIAILGNGKPCWIFTAVYGKTSLYILSMVVWGQRYKAHRHMGLFQRAKTTSF